MQFKIFHFYIHLHRQTAFLNNIVIYKSCLKHVALRDRKARLLLTVCQRDTHNFHSTLINVHLNLLLYRIKQGMWKTDALLKQQAEISFKGIKYYIDSTDSVRWKENRIKCRCHDIYIIIWINLLLQGIISGVNCFKRLAT